MIPLLVARIKKIVGATLSDIEYLAIKKFDGKIRLPSDANPTVATGSAAGATGAFVTVTANTGKDLYLAKAKINWFTDGQVISPIAVALKINGEEVERFTYEGEADYHGVYEYVQYGHKVAATQTITLDLITADADIKWNGSIECWDEESNKTPAIL